MLRVNKSRASKGRSPYARTRSSVAIATSATQSQDVRTPMQPEPPVVVPIRTLSATSTSSVAGIASTAGLSSLTAQQTNPEAIPVSVASVIDTVASQQSTTLSAPTGVAGVEECRQLMDQFEELCQYVGVPLANEKTEGPCTRLSFLGLGIDSIARTVFVPQDKVSELLGKIEFVLRSKKVTKKEMESLLGSLAFVTKALPAGRAFCRRLYGALVGVCKSFHLIRVSKEIRLDLEMWIEFLTKFNGLSPFPSLIWLDNETLEFYTDSSGSHGCGVLYGDKWSFMAWPENWSSEIRKDITLLEFIPILLGIYIWGVELSSQKLLLHVDNMSLVHIVNNKTSKNPKVMILLRALVLFTLQRNIQLKCQHIPGAKIVRQMLFLVCSGRGFVN
ncbi:uncharacterized protein LOC134251060 isoform X2 [Saccostrea cucullata]|uniref:uncharacterized protein LOC134251060 isoform X2 n=1 Tax=Saccostrea cuccullata TaxID=36930 RepID=UPI002ED1F3AA